MAALTLHSDRTSALDRLRGENATIALQIAGVVGFAVLAALGAQMRIYLWEVPITLQTVAVYGAGLFLGSRNGLLAMGLYLLVGMFLPVFAGDGSGPSYILGAASGGYLVAMPIAAFVAGAVSRRWNTALGATLAVMCASAVLFTIGVSWLHVVAGHESIWTSIEVGWLRFVVWDLTKVLFVGALYGSLRSATAQKE